MIRRLIAALVYMLSLIAVLGLAMVQSAKYLEDFVSYSGRPALMYFCAFLAGVLLGLVTTRFGLLLVTPFIVVAGAAIVFFAVAYSPVWAGAARGSVALVNELTRQALTLLFLNLLPAYFGALIAGLVAQFRAS